MAAISEWSIAGIGVIVVFFTLFFLAEVVNLLGWLFAKSISSKLPSVTAEENVLHSDLAIISALMKQMGHVHAKIRVTKIR